MDTIDETEQPAIPKACDACGSISPYRPMMILGKDMTASMPHFCDACEAANQAASEAIAREREIAEMRDTWCRTVPDSYRETDIDHPGFNRAVWRKISTQPWVSRPIGLVGPPGRSKTRMLALAAKKAIYQRMTIGWANTYQIEEAITQKDHRRLGEDARGKLRQWSKCRILFLDDLGKCPWTVALEGGLFRILEERHGAGLITHWSMNPQPDDIEADYSAPEVLTSALDPDGYASKRNRFAPILSRLMNETLIVPVR